MTLGLLGRKMGMTQIYDDKGLAVPVTILELGPCTVLQVRTKERDGYEALQLGFADKPRRLAIRAERGHVARIESKRNKARQAGGATLEPKANCEPKRYIREFRLAEPASQKVGENLTVNLFENVAAVDVIGTTKGRGTTGVMKRHNFGGLGASHGVKRHHRAAGSQSGHATDRGNSGKKKKGKRMAGRYGNERVTVKNLKVVKVDPENNLLLVRGAVPGFSTNFLMVRPTNKRRKTIIYQSAPSKKAKK
ncbi:MAG TPA: 50S ribosomal protein L3 [Gemmatales bacterium]|nr:50S ribosomal protein L3 [Gemmatales bacterium]HMP59851.1 50S ribosomal protein L3 [Gemmatales bacterium]